jgi:hypothetical protein
MSTESESEEDSTSNDDESSSLLSLFSKLSRVLPLEGSNEASVVFGRRMKPGFGVVPDGSEERERSMKAPKSGNWLPSLKVVALNTVSATGVSKFGNLKGVATSGANSENADSIRLAKLDVESNMGLAANSTRVC